jgi:hypothetical protein
MDYSVNNGNCLGTAPEPSTVASHGLVARLTAVNPDLHR